VYYGCAGERFSRVAMPTKDEVARTLATLHYRVEEGMRRIHRIRGSDAEEERPDEPIKLLEANANTIPTGILPLPFRPLPAAGIHFRSVIAEVTPAEYRDIRAGDFHCRTVGEWGS